MLRRCAGDALNRVAVLRMRELARDAKEVGEIEMAEPHDIHPVDRGDRFDVVEPGARFDHADDERAAVDRSHLLDHITALVVVVREAERGAAPSFGRVAGEGDYALGLFGRVDERHHDAEGAGIERARGEMIFNGRNAHERRYAERPAERELRLERLVADTGVLHAVHDELSAGVGADARDPGGEELEHHRAERRLAGSELLFQRIKPGSHSEIAGMYVTSRRAMHIAP